MKPDSDDWIVIAVCTLFVIGVWVLMMIVAATAIQGVVA